MAQIAIVEYIKELDRLFQTGLTTEHSFRPALQKMLEQMCDCTVVNEQSHIDCGAPDLTLLRKKLAFAYVEAKYLEDGDLDGRRKNKEQFDRYKASLDTILFTDYLDFHLYEHGEWIMSVRLAEIQGKHIRLSDEPRFVALMEHLRVAAPQRITSAGKLAELMAGKARLLRDVIETAINNDIENGLGADQKELLGYMESFRQVLIHDITPKIFADIYAQTIAYGMFAARLHDTTPEDFTREEAANLIPKSNPFLRRTFQTIAGYDLDSRIAWIVDDLVHTFAATDMDKIMAGFGKQTQMTDPLMHFYEDFLYQYDSAAKKQCGVYYTPQPVVNFIVRAVDDILRKDFGLPLGLADTSKVEREREIQQDNKHRKEKVMMHRVQVLDPATGTGTFLAAVVRKIKETMAGQMGAWNSYAIDHLLPRLHGFELMMAPYTITHLKLDLEIGAPHQDNNRLKVYLTNSLEEANPDANTIFGNILSSEANAASAIKKSAPIMVMIGNPPYSVSSNNKGEWISGLLEDYKKNLNERNIQPLSDDYIKFIRLGQYYVERNGEGILAYISNNSFIDGLIHRQMRTELMRCFDDIYILDLHGNTRKKETTLDGGKDENVFDIMQGVSINIFVRKPSKKDGCTIRHYDLLGKREDKYKFLQEHNITNIEWTSLTPSEPNFFFVPKDFAAQNEYEKGFRIDNLLCHHVSGIKTQCDNASIFITKEDYKSVLYDWKNLSIEEIRSKYGFKDGRDWQISSAKNDVTKNPIILDNIQYRIFDSRQAIYTGTIKGIMGYPRTEMLTHVKDNNPFLVTCRQQSTFDFQHIYVTTTIADMCSLSSQTKEGAYVFPLYLYPDEGSMDTERRPNLDAAIWTAINEKVGRDTTPEEIFDYIYGVLHSPAYREKYKEFLKVDFPRVPYPESEKEFEHYIYYGHQLRELHLMHTIPNMPDIATLPVAGDWLVEQLKWDQGRVYVNAEQYFENVPRTAWDFYIGGYQPAQKWLKDRKGRNLSYDDLVHYSGMIKILIETDRLMREIDTACHHTGTPTQSHSTKHNQDHPTVVNHITYNINGDLNVGTMHIEDK